MKLKIYIFLVLLIPLMLSAIVAKDTELLGIPTADVLNNGAIDISVYVSSALNYSEDRVPFSYNFSFSYGLLNTMDISLHMYTYKDFALQFQYCFLKDKTLPQMSVGIKNITYRRYIDEAGGGDDPTTTGYYDYSWEERSSDIFSFYVVATKDFGAIGKYSVGIGRGEFVGYNRGRYLSTAAFFNETQLETTIINEFMFGFFGGFEIPITKGLVFLGDVDGRDVNIGLKFKTGNFSFSGALTHAELFTSNQDFQRPRIDVGINYIFDMGKKKKQSYGYLVINILDAKTNKMISGFVEFEGLKIKPILVKDGNVKMRLKPGKYTVKIDAEGYKWQKRILTIAGNATNEINVTLTKKYSKEQQLHDKAIALAKQAKKYLKQGNVLKAMENLKKAKELAPNDPTVLAYYKQANDKLQSVIATHKSNALAYEKKGWYKSAKNEWAAVLSLDKNNAEAKAKYNEMDKKIKQKTETAKKKAEPKKDPEKLYNEGYKYFLDGNYAKAIEKFSEVLKINPNHKKAKQYLKKAKARL